MAKAALDRLLQEESMTGAAHKKGSSIWRNAPFLRDHLMDTVPGAKKDGGKAQDEDPLPERMIALVPPTKGM